MNIAMKSPLEQHTREAVKGSLSIEMMELIHKARSKVSDRMLRLPQVREKLGRANSTIWNDVRNGILPPPVTMGPRTVAWSEVELQAWIDARVFASRTKTNVDIKFFVALLTAPQSHVTNIQE
ncbi:helix-turn-helix transcriptional regulator [Janthinobacterium lividum]|jgi:prophage regulatory protein|uniref:AlpA family phage regulatory protein n=1 Tax=Janthinobacterium lividum TaxID=29581 RepID=A0ABU0XRS3_9BURK|nr:AlpA family phage regulatory protein [Janthinobacterium lividum]MDQ4626210.1 AlpA family phage regulatory protein [Janthinobacterium lividum]MDQ4674823.1 AlpA family phage regulatory protein [Janthinobacterium lividum]MDQ4685555.1 AlpA family phage regulatory protein [Janthinobacterium lividum]